MAKINLLFFSLVSLSLFQSGRAVDFLERGVYFCPRPPAKSTSSLATKQKSSQLRTYKESLGRYKSRCDCRQPRSMKAIISLRKCCLLFPKGLGAFQLPWQGNISPVASAAGAGVDGRYHSFSTFQLLTLAQRAGEFTGHCRHLRMAASCRRTKNLETNIVH